MAVWPPSTEETGGHTTTSLLIKGGCTTTTSGQGWSCNHHDMLGVAAWPPCIYSHPDQLQVATQPPLSSTKGGHTTTFSLSLFISKKSCLHLIIFSQMCKKIKTFLNQKQKTLFNIIKCTLKICPRFLPLLLRGSVISMAIVQDFCHY